IQVDTHQLDTAAAQLELFGKDVDRKLEPARAGFQKLGDDAERETGKVVRGMKNVSDSSDIASQKMFDFGRAGIQPMNALIGIAVAAGIALAPLIAFTAGLAATLAMLTLVVGGLGLMGVGIIALAEHAHNWAESSKALETAQKGLNTATNA